MFLRKKKVQKEAHEDFFGRIEQESGRREEERKRILAVVTYLADGVLVFDKKNRLSLVNPQAEKLLQVQSKAVVGRAILQLNTFPLMQPLVSFLGGGMRECFRKELSLRENFIVEVSSIPMMIGEEKIGTLVLLRDVSREKFVERTKSEFITIAAHRLRTPMSAIKWSLHMILGGEIGKLSDSQQELLQETYHANNKAIKLVNDLLYVAEIEAGRHLSKVELARIEDIVYAVIDGWKKKIDRKLLKVTFQKPDPPVPKTMLDVEKMRIAVENIIDNAIRYTSSGGKIAISFKVDGGEIEVRIQDTGLGIPDREQDKVFTKFFRGTNVIRVDTEGTGLGLYITKHIIEAHGGRIWLESKKGKGTTFFFTIPVRKKFAEFITGEFY